MRVAGRMAVGAMVACLAAFGSSGAPALAAPNVVASIGPVHSLVAGVMDGIGEPDLLVRGGGSPHTYSLRPSDARALNEAGIVFWVGESLETFLARPLEALTADARVVELAEAPGIELLPTRGAGAWSGEEAHEDGTTHEEEHAAHHDAPHGHGRSDLHIWLDPRNAAGIVDAAARVLAELDPANAERYRMNGQAMRARIDELDRDLADSLRPVRSVPFVVFHDAFQYFEASYGLNAAGSITISPGRLPGAGQLSEMRETIRTTGAACVFSEPQFEPSLARTVTEGSSARMADLDPLGTGLAPGPGAYFRLMRDLAGSLKDCLLAGS